MYNLEGRLKLIDFGLSKKFNDYRNMRTKVGTLVYSAPEIFQ